MPSRRTNNFPESGRGLGHVTPTIFGSTVGYPSDSLASCWHRMQTLFSKYRSCSVRAETAQHLDKHCMVFSDSLASCCDKVNKVFCCTVICGTVCVKRVQLVLIYNWGAYVVWCCLPGLRRVER